MMRRRVISRAPRTVGPSHSLPIVRRACFLVSGQLPAGLLRNWRARQEIQAASGTFSQASDGETGGIVLNATGNAGSLLFTGSTGEAQKPSTGLTALARVNLPGNVAAGQYLFGRPNSTKGKASFGLLTTSGLTVASGSTNSTDTNSVTGFVTVSGTVSGSVIVGAWRAGSPFGSGTVSGTTVSCYANESQDSAGDNFILTTTPVSGTTTTAVAAITGDGSTGDVYGVITAQVKAGASGMTVVVDSQEPGASGHASGPYAGPPLTWNFTNTAGDLLIVGVTLSEVFYGPGTMTLGPVTYGGVTMTAVSGTPYGGDSTNDLTGLYYLLNPPTGSNQVNVQFSTSSGFVDCMAGAISFKSGGGSVLVFEATNQNSTTDTPSVFIASGWHTVAARYRSGASVDLSVFDDNGIKVASASGVPASGSIAWDTTSAITLMQAMPGALDFALLTPNYESDSAIGSLVRRRAEMFSALRTGQLVAPGGVVYSQSLSAAASGTPGALGRGRGVAIDGTANASVLDLSSQKASTITNKMRVVASLLAPGRTFAIPAITVNASPTLMLGRILRALSASADISVTAVTLLETRAMAASGKAMASLLRGLTAVAEATTTSAAAIVVRYAREHVATTTTVSADFIRRLIRTADTASANVTAAMPLSKRVTATGSAKVTATMGSRTLDRTLAVAQAAGAATIARAVKAALLATVNGTAALGAGLGNAALAATTQGAATLARLPAHRLRLARATFNAALARQPGKVRAANVEGIATLAPSREYERALDATVQASPSLVKQLFRVLTAAAQAIASLATASKYPPEREIFISSERLKISSMLGEKLR